MSLTNLIIPGQGDGKIANLFYSVERSIIVHNFVIYRISYYILKFVPLTYRTLLQAGYAYFTDILSSDFMKSALISNRKMSPHYGRRRSVV